MSLLNWPTVFLANKSRVPVPIVIPSTSVCNIENATALLHMDKWTLESLAESTKKIPSSVNITSQRFTRSQGLNGGPATEGIFSYGL